MSYEMKDILKTMIDNNEPHWSADTMDMVRVEIHNVYAQAAKADEYEAKAKAFDDIREARKEVLTDVRARGLKLPADLDKFSLMTERIINEYERGESE